MMQALTLEQQRQLLEQQLLQLYGDPALGRWTPSVPRPGSGDPLTQGEFDWLITLRQIFCPDTEEFDSWIDRMKAERGGAPPQDLLQALNAIESNKSLAKREPCDLGFLMPRKGHNLAPPRLPQPDPQPWMQPALVRMPQSQPQPPPQAAPNPYALERQPGSYLPFAAPAQTRLRGVLLAGQAQRQREQAATGKLVYVYAETEHEAKLVHRVWDAAWDQWRVVAFPHGIRYRLNNGVLSLVELEEFLLELHKFMKSYGPYHTARCRGCCSSAYVIKRAKPSDLPDVDKNVLITFLEETAMIPDVDRETPALMLEKLV